MTNAADNDLRPILEGTLADFPIAELLALLAATKQTGTLQVAVKPAALVTVVDGRVAFAALEPHFAAALFKAAGLPMADLRAPFAPAAHATIAAWALGKTRHQLDALGRAHDIPLYTLAR